MKINKNLAISDTGFLFNPLTGESFSVNPIGAEIINLLKEGNSPEKVIRHLCAHYHCEEATVEKDLFDFMEVLKQHSLTGNNEKE